VPEQLAGGPVAVPTQPTGVLPPSAPPSGVNQTIVPTQSADEARLSVEFNATDGRRGGAFNSDEIARLPLGAATFSRSFDELALLLPGVALPPQTQGRVAGPGVGGGVGSAGQFAVNGLRSRGNNFTVDGSDNNDEDIGVRRQGFFALVPQPIESVQEYVVITSLAPAQFGRNFGAYVNANSKSGGQQVHGTLYGFLNTSDLNARNFFDTNDADPAVPLRSADGRQDVLDCTGVGGTTILEFNDRCRSRNTKLLVPNNSAGKDRLTHSQGGFAFGAPLVRDRLFSFFSYERQVLNAQEEAHFAVPTVDERGVFKSGATGLERFTDLLGNPTIAFPTSIQGDAIFSLIPFPNDPTGVYGANTFTQVLPANARSNVASGRLDGNFNINRRLQTITARYNFTGDWRDIPVTGGAIFSTLKPRVRTHNVSTYLNSEINDVMFNEVRFSYGRTRLRFDEVRDTTYLRPSSTSPEEPFLLNAPLVFNATLPGAGSVFYGHDTTTDTESLLGRIGQINIAGFSPVGVDVFNFEQSRVNHTYQFADTLSWRLLKGHNLSLGADIRITNLNSDLQRNSRTLLNFNGNPAFDDKDVFYLNPTDLAAAGVPSGAFLSLASPVNHKPDIRLRYFQYNFFAQDEWRIRPNISLSYGLRYEYNTPPSERDGIIERTFRDPILSNPAISGVQQYLAGRSKIFDEDRNNFAPRLSVAYSPSLFGNSRSTLIRAGYGLHYDQAIGAVVSQSRNVIPNFLTVNTGGFVLPFPDVRGYGIFLYSNPAAGLCGEFDRNNGQCKKAVSLVRANTLNTLNLPINETLSLFPAEEVGIFPNAFSFTLPARRFEMPTGHQYAFTFEQQVVRNLIASVGYIGTQGQNLLRTTTPNLGPNNIVFLLGGFASGGSPYFVGTTLSPISGLSQENFKRPTPGLGSVTIYETEGHSRYDALQLQLRGRLSTLDFQLNYTLSKARDDVSDMFDLAGAYALPQNSITRSGERGPANFDARHRIAYNASYAFPTPGLNSRVKRFFLGGFEVIGTGQFQTGQPFTVNSIIDVNLDGNLTDRLNTTSGIRRTNNRRSPYQLTGDSFLLAGLGDDGKVERNTFRGTSFLLLNLALIKHFQIKEQQRLTFRVEGLNFTDRANFALPVRFLEAPSFGTSTETVTPGRRIQFALKYSF
jgi:hypothetical protein